MEPSAPDGFPRLLRSLPVGWVITSQWARVYRDLVGVVAYRSQSLSHPLLDLVDYWRSLRAWRELRRTRNTLSFECDGILVGDLIIDSYLRYRPSERFRVDDPFVRYLLWQSMRDVRRAKAYFSRRRPVLYLSSYSTYIEHGVPVRVAVSRRIPVRVFGNLITFGKRLSNTDTFHTTDTSRYQSEFASLPNKGECLDYAERELQVRIAGGIDAATSYMRESAYARSGEAVPDVAGCVVMFLHDFFDSPHIYADLVFEDFWSWCVCTIETLMAAGVKFWLKPHPNQVVRSAVAIGKLQAIYPGLQMLSTGVTNVQLVDAGIICGVTAYGSVAHELAYLGVPSIACARHPHHSFQFCRTARSLEEYRSFLRTANAKPLTKAEMRRQALAFYYMHNLHGSPAARALRQQYASLWRTMHAPDSKPDEVIASLQQMRRSQGWREFIDGLGSDVALLQSSAGCA